MKKNLILLLLLPLISLAQHGRESAVQKVRTFRELGTFYNMYIGNRMPFTDIEVEGGKNFRLTGTFVIDYGTDTTVVDTMGFMRYHLYKKPDNHYKLTFRNGSASSDVFSPYCYDNQNCSSIKANGISQAGIIGTDILSQLIVTFDYQYSRMYLVWNRAVQCQPAQMREDGYLATSTKGYFSNERKQLVLSDTNNVPTIPITLGNKEHSVKALAQIDPGYDDRCHLDQDTNHTTYYTHIININKLFYDYMKQKGIDIIVDKQSFYTLGNRSGKPDTLYRCVFNKRYMFNVIGTKDEKIIPYSTDEINVFLKVNSPGGESAGGITKLPFPAAQFGGSFLMDCDRVTFDPFRSLVWFQTRRTPPVLY